MKSNRALPLWRLAVIILIALWLSQSAAAYASPADPPQCSHPHKPASLCVRWERGIGANGNPFVRLFFDKPKARLTVRGVPDDSMPYGFRYAARESSHQYPVPEMAKFVADFMNGDSDAKFPLLWREDVRQPLTHYLNMSRLHFAGDFYVSVEIENVDSEIENPNWPSPLPVSAVVYGESSFPNGSHEIGYATLPNGCRLWVVSFSWISYDDPVRLRFANYLASRLNGLQPAEPEFLSNVLPRQEKEINEFVYLVSSIFPADGRPECLVSTPDNPADDKPFLFLSLVPVAVLP